VPNTKTSFLYFPSLNAKQNKYRLAVQQYNSKQNGLTSNKQPHRHSADE